MNVYDFDNTILRGDSTALFVLYCFTHKAGVWKDAPGQLINAISYLLKKKDTRAFKERLFTLMLPRLRDTEETVRTFWEKNTCRVKPFYLETRREDDVIISASPEFLIAPVMKELGVSVFMGTRADPVSGRIDGLNCHDEEKVRRFRERFPEGTIGDFYSDSHSDDPLAKIAGRAFMVKGEKLTPWKF